MFMQTFASKLWMFSNVNKFRSLYTSSIHLKAEIIEKWKKELTTQGVSEVDTSIRFIVEHVVNHKMNPSKQNYDENNIEMTKEQMELFEQLCECRAAKMPVQYIIREWDFCDLTLKMVPPVFIPRPETEQMIELICQKVEDELPIRFLEIGCGSGAISLALLDSLPKAECVAIDQSEYACKLTLENAMNLKLMNRLKVLRLKLTDKSEISELPSQGEFDLIVSNPPYVPTNRIKTLASEIVLYEDLRALDGGPDGLDIVKNILKFASNCLKLNGHLWLEVDTSHPKLIEEYLKEHSQSLQFIGCHKDLFGNERFVEIKKI